MTFSPIDAVLLAALAYVGWSSARMTLALRRLRSGESELATALRDADACINDAALAVVMLRGEGVETLRAIEARIVEARELADELEAQIRVADRKLQVANDAVAAAPAASPTAQDTWLRLIESRLASGSAPKR